MTKRGGRASGRGVGGRPGGSVHDYWEPLRLAGATAREILIQAAAERWGVPAGECHASVAPMFADRFGNLDRFFSDDVFFRPFQLFNELTEGLSQRGWVPPVDIRETDEAYVVRADLPGFTKKDVEITLEDNVLTLRGERKWDEGEQAQSYRRIERAYGEFTRSFHLPAQVDADDVQARFDNGVLTVTVPKTAESRPRRIAIH